MSTLKLTETLIYKEMKTFNHLHGENTCISHVFGGICIWGVWD